MASSERVGDRTYEAIMFDWDGTAVADRQADASGVRERVEALCAAGVHVFVVSGTHVQNVDGQLGARPPGSGSLHLCLNRGSEVFAVGVDGPRLVWARSVTPAEDSALDVAAARTVERLARRGLETRIVSHRLNRRKIDLIPDPAWADPPKARIAPLLDAVTTRLACAGIADLGEVVAIAAASAREAGLLDARITNDVKHVEIGLTDKSDSGRWAAAWLADRGISGSLILVGGDEFGSIGGVPGSDSFMLVTELARARAASVGVEPSGTPSGVEHLGGGPARFLALLDEQLERRSSRRVPAIDDDPKWVVPIPTDLAMERVAEAIGSLANGWVGARGTHDDDGRSGTSAFLVGGVYDDDDPPALLRGPSWTHVRREVPCRDAVHRRLDLRGGLLATDDPGGGYRSLRFVSLARPHAVAVRAEARDGTVEASAAPPGDAIDGGVTIARTGGNDAGIVVAMQDRSTAGETSSIERLAAWEAGAGSLDESAEAWLADARGLGFEGLLSEHRHAWAERWADAAVDIDGAPGDELAARFAVFHLLTAAPDRGEAAVGARGLTGGAYGGHVFWDADVFVLPALAAIRPACARAMLEYRIRRLSAARAAASKLGLRGARFPWESAGDGSDVTPRWVVDAAGRAVPVQTGCNEEHIVADIAWAACRYAQWTGESRFLAGPGRALVVETARYWADRIHLDDCGAGHLFGVMGADEYHPAVDDNAFTNLMARWNLRRGADLLESEDAEADTWRSLAERLVDAWDSGRHLYEQFAGYWDLEPLKIEQIATPPVAVDMLLGADRVEGSQLIKQPDVLMAHHLIPEELVPGSLRACLDFYEPRCAHGSSLSPAIHASLFARAGQPERALSHFRVAARLDLDDLTGTTAGGVHLATMGGLWQALAYGFLGLRASGAVLHLDPCLPESWTALTLRLRFHGIRVRVRAEGGAVDVACSEPLLVAMAGGPPVVVDPPGRRMEGVCP